MFKEGDMVYIKKTKQKATIVNKYDNGLYLLDNGIGYYENELVLA